MRRALFLIFWLVGGLAMSQILKPVREIEGITEYRLKNGLTYLSFPDDSQSTVTVNLTILVGSRHEGRGEAGMAHLLEHMLFKGTPKYPDGKGVLQSKGAFFNATTWFDRTNYFETMPASDDNLKFGLEFESDRMINSWIRQADLDAEMTVVRNEFEIGENDPVSVLHDQMMSAAFRWHNYGKTTIGNRSDIERVPVPNLKAFYQKYYQPDNAVLIVAGKFDQKKALQWVQEYFGKIKKPSRVLDKTYTQEPTQDGSRFVKLMRAGEVAAAGVVYHVPAGSQADFAAIRILTEVMAQEPGGYLYDQLVKTGKVSELYGMVYSLAEPGALMVLAKPVKTADVNSLKDELIDDIENKLAKSITAEDVERAKTKLLKNYKIAMSSSKDLALRLSESIAQGDYRLYFWQRDQIKKVTLEEVQKAAKHYLVESNRTAGVFVPTDKPLRADIPQTPEVDKMLASYVSAENVSEGERFEATAENIDKSTQHLKLDNGIRAAFLSKKTRGDVVKAKLVFRFGSENSLKKYRECFGILPQLMMRGTQTKSHQQIQDELDTLQSTLRMSGNAGKTVVDITSDKANFNAVLKLLAEVMKTPALSSDEFEILRKKELSGLEEALMDPKALGFTELDRLQNPWPETSIYYVSSIPEQIQKMKSLRLEDLKKLYQRFYASDHLELAIVGSFDVEAVKSEINRQFGTWRSQEKYERITKPYQAVKPQMKVLYTPDKQMALLAMGTNLPIGDNSKDYPAMKMGAYVLGEGMKSRIWRRLREHDGLSYGAGSWFEASKINSNAALGLYAMAATDNANKALTALKEEYEKWVNKGISEQELQESKESLRSTVENLWANDGYVVGTLVSNLEIDRNFGFESNLLKQIDQLTTQEVQSALKQYVLPAGLVEVKAGDFRQ